MRRPAFLLDSMEPAPLEVLIYTTPEWNEWIKERGKPWRLNGVKEEKPLTGWSSDYYKLKIARPTDAAQAPYFTECNDIIEALGMSFAEGNAFKALWRIAAKRMGNGKPGTTALYDAEKVAFFGQRLVEIEKARQ